MSSYILKFTNKSGESGTMVADAGFNYTDKLNAINDANIKISGSSVIKRSLIEVGSISSIYRNGTLEFYGLVNNVDYLDGGAISIYAQGYEAWLAKENGDYANSPWDDTASATIFTSLIGESSYFTSGTIETGQDIDLRVETTDSIWNAINNLKTKTGQDIGIDYPNLEIDILDHKGSSTSVATFNNGIQIKNMRVSQSYPLGNDIRVYGKGDGSNQIKSNFSTAGQDATSKSAYGTIRKIVRDPSVLTTAEANILANALVAIYKNPIKIYDFDIINPNQSIVSGDVVTLNSPSQGLSNEEVRVVRLERGVRNGNEYLTIQVTNKEYSILVKNKNEIIAGIEKNAREQQTYMQGTTNVLTFSQQINATSTAPLRIQGNLPASFIQDEAGKLRVNSFTLDYDVDPFRASVGTASESDVAPGVAGSSGSYAPGVSGSSSYVLSTFYPISDTFSNVSCSSGSWTTVLSLSSTDFIDDYGSAMATGNSLICYLYLSESSGGPEDMYIRVNNSYSGEEFLTFIPDVDSASGIVTFSDVGAGIFSTTGQSVQFQVKPTTGALNVSGGGGIGTNYHRHADGTYGADSHPHSDGTYSADSHNHSVSVGDAISDEASINATQVSIYVDWWNGSSWTNKHSILNTGKTLDTDVDISNGGTLPDAVGYWRARIITNNASPDLVNGIMKVKHELDT